MTPIPVLAEAIPVVAPAEADGVFSLLWLIAVLPAFGAALILLLGNRRSSGWAHLLGTATVALSFLLGLVSFVTLLGRDEAERSVGLHLYTWFETGSFTADLGILYDPLSSLFVLLVTGVGGLIHVYSIGYMEHDERRARFFAYLNLFIAAMVVLVLSDGYLGVFLGWEGVGLASYLLIGFWQHKTSAAVAAKKAFVVNRVGDIGLALGTMLLFVTFGTVSFAGVSELAAGASDTTLNLLGLLLLLAACGKSAQVPLQSWLLDAMEGPTPVSALIHAATMVTAGVYLVVRSNFIFERTEVGQTAVVIVGTVTLLAGAVIGCAKDDIKKALAGSTMSQIGYMMLAAGLGVAGYAFAIFHLITHGFFKANMFLGAGSVMHAMDDDVNMRHYGALQKAVPVTFVTFALGYLAILGVPPFAGFWSKDKIIEAAFGDNIYVGIAALLGAGVTAFYMTRLMIMTFLSEKRWAPDVHPHESPRVMTVPLMVLAALSALGGLMLLGGFITDWLAPVVGEEEHHELGIPVLALTAIVLLTVAAGVAVAWFTIDRAAIPREAPQDVSVLTRAARHDLYGDAFNEEVLMRPGTTLVDSMATFDDTVVDGVVDGTGRASLGVSGAFRRLQTGYVRSYALSVLLGALLVVLALLAVSFRMSLPWLTLALVLPLVGALALMLLPRGGSRGGTDVPQKVALGFSVATLLLVVVMALGYDVGTGGFQYAETHEWIAAFGAHYALGVDGLGLTMVVLTAILTPVVIAASWRDGDAGRWSSSSFFAWMLVLEGLAIGTFAATDVFLFYVLFEATLFPIYFLIGGFGGARRGYAATKFLLFSLLGGLVMLASVVGVYVLSMDAEGGPTYLVTELAPILADADTSTARWLFVGFFIAFAAKAPMVPVHTWLPDATDEATPGTSVLLVSILDKIGTFGMIRFCLGLFPEASTWATPVVLVLAVVSVLYGGLVAINQRSIPRLIAYTSVSHFGFIVLGIFVMNSQGHTGAILYMFNHGLSTAVLFGVTGFLISRGGSKYIADYGGVQKVAPVLAGVFLVGGLSSLSLPGLSPFVSEFLVITGAFVRDWGWAVAVVLGIVIAALYILLMFQRTMTGPLRDGLESMKDLNAREVLAMAPLLALIIGLGFFPQPLIDVVEPTVEATLTHVGAADPGPTVSEATEAETEQEAGE